MAMLRTTTFRPHLQVDLFRVSGFNSDGSSATTESTKVGISIVTLDAKSQKTPLRLGQSGSVSRAEELIYDGRVLIHPKHDITHGDVLEIFGLQYKIESIFPRYEISGLLNHNQVELNRWVN